jgi:hypothetical protein
MEQLKSNQSSRCGYVEPLNNRAVPGLPMLTRTTTQTFLSHIHTKSKIPNSHQSSKELKSATIQSQRTRKTSNTITGVCHVIHPTYSGALRNKGNSVYYKRTSEQRSHPHFQQQ